VSLYRQHILDLYKNPHNFGKIEGATHEQRVHNPLCGDDITIQLIIKEDMVEDIHFTGTGCAISMAAASILTDKVKGMKVEEIKNMKAQDILEAVNIPLGPVRIKCALLSLEAVHRSIA